MYFRCQFCYYPQPFEPNLYIQEMTVEVLCGTDEEGVGDGVVAARLAVDVLDISRAQVADVRIYDICDADSAGWEHVYSAMFDPDSQAEWRRDFDFYEPITRVLFLYRSVFHPELRDWQSFVIDHVAKLFGEDSVLVMWKDKTDLSDSELARLGFRIIAGSDLLLRPNMFQHEYDASEDERDTLDFNVAPDAAKYVDAAWKKDEQCDA